MPPKVQGDKREQWFGSIMNEKLDTLKYSLLHSGVNCSTLKHEGSGLTGMQMAALNNKHKALLVILDTFKRQRELAEAIDIQDDEGRTALHLAASRGHVKCLDHLIYYKANALLKCNKGKTAQDYANESKNSDAIEFFKDLFAPPEEDTGVAEEDADGLTSTQRNKLKKKQLEEARAAALAAVAALKTEGTEEAAAVENSSTTDINSTLPALPETRPEPVWPEVAEALADGRREIKIDRKEYCAIDPALFYCSNVNRLEIHIPGLTTIPEELGHLNKLLTLNLSKCNIKTLPNSISYLKDLKALDVSMNDLESLPESIGQLTKLELLDVSHNHLTSLGAVAELKSLLVLKADKNELLELNLNFKELNRLGTLSVSFNKLTSLPDDIGLLEGLSDLNVTDNEITELPSGMTSLNQKKIKTFSILPNPIEDKKVLKVLNKDRASEIVKELFKLLEGSGKGKGKGKK